MTEAANRDLIRTTSRFAFFVALATFFTVPGIYLWTALSYEHNRLHVEAENGAAGVAKLALGDPKRWRFQENGLQEMLSRDLGARDGARVSVFAPDGQEIVSVGQPPGFLSIQGEASITDGHGAAATVVVAESAWPLVFKTGGVVPISLALSLAVFFALKIMPLRALKLAVSDFERSEVRLRAEKENAELANRAKTEFLANMSHELRTPLNAVIGFSEIIKDQTFGPVGSAKYHDYATDIHDAGQHVLGLINDILDLSKIEFGKGELHEVYVEIAETVRAVRSLIWERTRLAGVELVWDVPSDLPPLRADERKLKQMLVNLLTNALKFTEAGGTITLKVRCPASEGFNFQVTDTGVGIAPEDVAKALSQFGQIESGLARQHEGSGLGLPLTRALIELHGGSLDLQSELGAGTTVTLCFPATRVVRLPSDFQAVRVAESNVG